MYWSIRLSLLQLFKVNFPLLLHEYIRMCALLSPSRELIASRDPVILITLLLLYIYIYSYVLLS
jgi:hypothetical protein